MSGWSATVAWLGAILAPRSVILIDGGSGSGKTSLATALVGTLNRRGTAAHLVSLDSFYPGWSGLAAASQMVLDDVLDAEPGFRQWDWEQDQPGAWVSLPTDQTLVIEGCGALTPATAARATLGLWLERDADRRKELALARDGEGFAPYWDMWAAQEADHWRRHDPRSLADVMVELDVT